MIFYLVLQFIITEKTIFMNTDFSKLEKDPFYDHFDFKRSIYYNYKGDFKLYDGDYIVYETYKTKYWVSPYSQRVSCPPVRVASKSKFRS